MGKTVIIFTLCIALFSLNSCAQQKHLANEKLRLCSEAMLNISEGWKADSLAGNGYRLDAHESLTTCKLDSISADFLIKTLGKPYKILKYEDEHYYQYRYYDSKFVDTATSKWKVRGWSAVTIVTDTSGTEVTNIGQSNGEY